METFTATAGGELGWEFVCPLHSEPFKFFFVSGPNHALSVMKKHMDDSHPGIKIRLKSISGEVTLNTTYTAVTDIIPTKDYL